MAEEKKNNNNNETFEFQAEIKQLLDILARSLYKNKDIFVRELISNASDALSKVRIETLTNKNVLQPDLPLDIKIEVDEEKNILSISDTGIGMTKQNLIDNIGTIARSGTMEFIKNISETGNKDVDIIGQFGVGFYSTFMVAKKVRITTKSYLVDEPAYEWISDGEREYELNKVDISDRGTKIEVFLNDDESEFIKKDFIKDIIKKYSNFVSYPIIIDGETVNQISAIWTKSKSDVTDEQYNEFYKFISFHHDDPMFHIHFSADAPIQFHSLLYVPSRNFDMFDMSKVEYGLNLYSNKVLIQNNCSDLLPEYLRFMRGIVDSEDVPLNVSRETIQNNKNIHIIKNNLISKFLGYLEDLSTKDEEKYNNFWNEYGKYIKEGVLKDFANRDRIANLLMFNSSKHDNKNILLKTYVDNMKPEQKEIYYILGADRNAIEKNPHFEVFKKHDIEVLYVHEAFDDFMMSSLEKFNDKPIKSADKANLEFIKDASPQVVDTSEEPKNYQSKFEKLIAFFKSTLGDRIIDVVESKRLTESPCCVVNTDQSPSTHVQILLKSMNQDYQMMKKVLEINRTHPLVQKLAEINENEPANDLLKEVSEQLFENALLLEGIVDDVPTTVNRMNNILHQAVELKLGSQRKIIY